MSAVAPRRDRAVVATVVAVTALAFVSALTGDFVAWDDDVNFSGNPHFRGLGWQQIRWAFTTSHLGVYQPLAWLALELQFVIGGLSPAVYHLASWLLHALNAALVYRLIATLLDRARGGASEGAGGAASRPAPQARFATIVFSGSRTPALRAGAADDQRTPRFAAAAAALLWALHPLRAEAVAWASCQPYLLATAFALLATLAYLSAPSRFAAALLLYLAAVLSKAEAIALPFVWLVLDVYPLRRLGGAAGWWRGAAVRRVWLGKLPFVVIAAGASIAAVAARDHEHHLVGLDAAGVGPRLAHAAVAVWFYVGKTFAPWTLSPYYPRSPELARGLAAPAAATAAVAAIALTALLVWRARRAPGLCAAWIAYLVFLLPHAGLVRISNQLGADRYTYLSSVAFAAAAAGGLAWLARGAAAAPRLRRALAPSVAAVLVVFAVLTVRQTDVWESTPSFWSFVYARSGTTSGHVANNWGAVLLQQQRYREAAEVLSRAVALSPRNAKAFHNLGIALTHTGADADASAAFAEETRLSASARTPTGAPPAPFRSSR